jgi:hypothetical protein
MPNSTNLPIEASPQINDWIFSGRGNLPGSERRPTLSGVLALFKVSFDGYYQSINANLTSLASVPSTVFGRSLLTTTDASGVRSVIGAGTSSFDGVYSSLSGIPSSFVPSAHTHLWSEINSTPTTLLGYGITDPVVKSSQSYENPTWITSLAYSKLTGAPSLAPVATSGSYADLTGVATIDDLLPSQSGNSGRYLTTNGATASWSQLSAGGDMVKSVYDQNDDGIIAIPQGGTGSSSASGARTALGLGTASTLNAPAAGNAAIGEVVKGDDARLSDARAPLAHTHPASDIDDSTTAGRAMLVAASAAAQRTLLSLGTAALSATGDFATSAHVHATATVSVSGFISAADKTKLDGISSGATVNATDSQLRDRSTHTGAQASSTISDFNSSSRAQLEAMLIAGANISLTPSGSGDTRTVSVSTTADMIRIIYDPDLDGIISLSQGGTGSSTAEGARTALGLGALATLTSVNNSNWSGVSLSISNGGTGSSDAATARINLGCGGAETLGRPVGSTPATSTEAVTGQDPRLTDSRTPAAHAASHGPGSSDPIKLDDLALPDDNTDLNANTTRHGLCPKFPGGTSNFLREDGSFANPSASSTPPGGTPGKVQYNNAGAFGGADSVGIENGVLRLEDANTPISPAVGGISLFSSSYSGLSLPVILRPLGISTPLQVGFHENSIFCLTPSNGTTAPSTIGGVLTTAATISHQKTIASANRWQATRRTRFSTSTTAGNASGMRTAYTQWYRGNAPGFGGFWFRAQFGMNINLNGGQKFIGLCASTSALAGEPSALVNMIGVGYDSTDVSTGNWFFMRNDGTGVATKVDLGSTQAARNTTHGYDLIMYLSPNSSQVFVKIVNLHTGVNVLIANYTTDIPDVNVGLAFKAEVRNGAQAAADNLETSKVYIESDY